MFLQLSLNSFLLSLFVQSIADPPLHWSFNADPIGGLPHGWELRGNSARPIYQIKAEPDGNRYVSANSQQSDVQLGAGLDVNTQEYPILSWRWRVLELPRGADERNQKTLDSAASVYVVFGSRLFPRVLKYVLVFTDHRDPSPTCLNAWGYSTCEIHGGKNPNERKRAQEDFQTTAH